MLGYYIVGCVLLVFVAFKISSDIDDQMEELLREKKAEDAEKLNK